MLVALLDTFIHNCLGNMTLPIQGVCSLCCFNYGNYLAGH